MMSLWLLTKILRCGSRSVDLISKTDEWHNGKEYPPRGHLVVCLSTRLTSLSLVPVIFIGRIVIFSNLKLLTYFTSGINFHSFTGYAIFNEFSFL